VIEGDVTDIGRPHRGRARRGHGELRRGAAGSRGAARRGPASVAPASFTDGPAQRGAAPRYWVTSGLHAAEAPKRLRFVDGVYTLQMEAEG
jgi:hypothetical protein